MKFVFAFVAGVVVVSPLAHATALNLVKGRPDIFADQVSVSYTASSHILHATGRAANMAVNVGDPLPGAPLNGTSPVTGMPSWHLDALIGDSSAANHGIFGAASFSIFGDYPSGQTNVLLMSSATIFAFGNSAGLLEFIFDNGTGPLNLNKQTGIILNIPGNPGTLAADFSVTFTSGADNFVIPAPQTALLGLFGGLAATRRRRVIS